MKDVQQTTAIIDSLAGFVEATQPEIITEIQPDPNYWWLSLIALLPVIAGGVFAWVKNKRKK